jgi:diguanylate cyclase (GGDEF)-like protein
LNGLPARLAWQARRLAAVPGRARASEYQQVGQSARFRAIERRRTRMATRAGMAVVALAVGFDALALFDLQAGSVSFALATDAAMLALAVLAWWYLPRTLRHRPELVAATVTLCLAGSTVATGVAVPSLAVETVGYLLVIPGLIALLLPWRTRVHAWWLVGYESIGLAYLGLDPSGRFSPDERGDLVVVLVIALGASLAGHVLLKAAQIRSFAQLEKIRTLRRRADADMLELERVHHALELTARIDPLTGAGNRRRLDEDLRAVRAHINRSSMSYGLVSIDLDRFKAINDRSGHQAGDEVLRRLVATIQQTLRAEDAIYRMGGEEFLVILHVASWEGLLTAAERLRATVAGLGIPLADNTPHGIVTISLGVNLIGPSDLVLTDSQWLERGDVALYAAKAGGRNQVVAADHGLLDPGQHVSAA